VAAVLRGLLAQQLCVRAEGQGRVPAADLLILDDETRDRLAAPNNEAELRQRMAAGRPPGSCTYDGSLVALVRRKRVTREEALAHADDPPAVARALAQAALGIAQELPDAETVPGQVEDDARAD
jgi:Tfp pilus assembly pilus retraction ATPase PilT